MPDYRAFRHGVVVVAETKDKVVFTGVSVMKTREGWMVWAVLAMAVPAWAHCGFCGKGGEAQKEGHGHANAEIGKPAPAFSLKDADGVEHKLADLKGKIVVLEWINHE